MIILSDGVLDLRQCRYFEHGPFGDHLRQLAAVPIHTIYINDDLAYRFMQLLAAQNFGTFYVFAN